MPGMQSANQPGAALDNLRTVEFRQTLRGYHIDDVDEYLERVAVEVEALQEQMRQAGERLRQATDRIGQLEDQPKTQAPTEAQARTLLDEAQQRAGTTVTEAEEKAKALAEDSERRVRDEVARLETLRTKLAGDVEAITRHLDTER